MRRTLFVLACITASARGAWLPGYTYRAEIECDTTKIAGTAKTNFPLLVTLTSTQDYVFAGAGATGDDIRFTKVGGDTLLAFEKVSYNSDLLTAEFWVLVPSLGDVKNKIWIYYGNADANDASSDDVWADYQAVAHYEHAAAAGYLLDASPDELTIQQSTQSGSWNTFSPATGGKIGRAWLYDFGETTSTSGLNVTAKQWTVSAWVFLYNAGGTDFLAQGDPEWFELSAQRGGGSRSMGYGSDSSGDSNSAIDMAFHDNLVTANQWNYIAFQMVASGDSMRCFLNGVMDASAEINPPGNHLHRHGIGDAEVFGLGSTQYQQPGGPDSMNGLVDELRVREGTPPNSNWLLTEYYNQNNPQTFYAVGEEETATCE